jgi:hypothetical protein
LLSYQKFYGSKDVEESKIFGLFSQIFRR